MHGQQLRFRELHSEYYVAYTWYLGNSRSTSGLHQTSLTLKHFSHCGTKASISVQCLQPGGDGWLPVSVCRKSLADQVLFKRSIHTGINGLEMGALVRVVHNLQTVVLQARHRSSRHYRTWL